MKMGM